MNLSRTLVAGIALAGLAVILFLVLWAGLGGAGMEQAPRLFVSLCVPPAVVGGLLIIWVLVRAGRGTGSA